MAVSAWSCRAKSLDIERLRRNVQGEVEIASLGDVLALPRQLAVWATVTYRKTRTATDPPGDPDHFPIDTHLYDSRIGHVTDAWCSLVKHDAWASVVALEATIKAPSGTTIDAPHTLSLRTRGTLGFSFEAHNVWLMAIPLEQVRHAEFRPQYR
jgi:hypothetical protein